MQPNSSENPDVFISYCHRDNKSSSESGRWVDTFHEALKIRLGQLFAYDPIIWRDRKLDGGDKFSQEIEDKIARTKIFMSVLSPSYINSEWCLRELNLFSDYAEKSESGGLFVANKSRAIKVIK